MPSGQRLGTPNDSTKLWRHGDTTLSTRRNGLMIQIGKGGPVGIKPMKLAGENSPTTPSGQMAIPQRPFA